MQRSTPLWLWPNLLSLDAPLVAVVWQFQFGRVFKTPLNPAVVALLAITVWLIYTADRTLDAHQGNADTARHRFYREHWGRFLPLWFMLFFAAAWIALMHLPRTNLFRGVALLSAVGIYLALVHRVLPGQACRRLKEAAVGILFALGASLTVWEKIRSPRDVAAVALFCGLCWMNCLAIERWEHHMEWSAAIPAATIAGLAFVLFGARPVLAGAIFASSLALVTLNLGRRRLSDNALRVLADAALLTPLLFLRVPTR